MRSLLPFQLHVLPPAQKKVLDSTPEVVATLLGPTQYT